jgi:molecular chaperone DnaJ
LSQDDLYRILGVARSASASEIRRAYQKCARHWHPDLNPGDPVAVAHYKAVSEAYEVLSDSKRRAAYDRGERSVTVTARVTGLDFEGFDFAPHGRGASLGVREILGSVLSADVAREPSQGENLELSTRLSFAEAFHGAVRRLQVSRQDHCAHCGGAGDVAIEPIACTECGGRGRVQVRRGAMVFGRTCPLCGGEGQLRRRPCPRCDGNGRVARSEWLEVRVPAGVEHGSRVTLAGAGNVGRRGGGAGDLILIVEVESHPFYRRDGADLSCTLPLTVGEAAAGGHVEAPTPDGPVMVEIGPGAQPGQRLRLRGRGMPRLGEKGRGDLWLEIQIRVPRVDDDRSRSLLSELMERHPERPREGLNAQARLTTMPSRQEG